jgi:hypothetical protein
MGHDKSGTPWKRNLPPSVAQRSTSGTGLHIARHRDRRQHPRREEPKALTKNLRKGAQRSQMATIYYSLYDRMLSKGNLYQGYLGVKKAKGSAGIDRQTIADFEENLEA